MKEIGYLLFAFFYYIFCLFCRRDSKKVFCVVTNNASEHGNVGMVVKELESRDADYKFHYYGKAERAQAGRIGKVFRFFLGHSRALASCGIILQDNVFLPMAYLKFPPKVQVIQLWHGTGTIKKFGQDVNTGRLGELEKKANSRITRLIVNGPGMVKQYAGAFGIPEDRVVPLGLPMTDPLLKAEADTGMGKLEEEYPVLAGKKLLLYAPTFRDEEVEHPVWNLDTELLLGRLPAEWVLGIRLHPHVAERAEVPESERIINLSLYPDLDKILLGTAALVTDYSSIIFDYCALRRPMYFYAYDLEQFSEQGRGFYKPYESFVPGPVVRTTKGLAEAVVSGSWDAEQGERFVNENYQYLDGNATERIVEMITKFENIS
ncbi:CDP-glycerol glycerophosphotransferase family protein [Anaerolentibacter hominis]|uniref:CDP-glycerol glycerophosphotransferase family protein n=1 Tax=Anaerolentibacter hominis TaxID=3079009 RepID=UPI0031B83675